MNNITFKMFLEAVFRRDEQNRMRKVEDDEDKPSYTEKQFIQAAKLIIERGFKKNFEDAVKNGFMYRGSSDYEYHFGDLDTFSMCYVQPERKNNRVSTYSGSQFCYNLWHYWNCPPRIKSTMASPNKNMSSKFNEELDEPFIVIPKDGTKCHWTPEDWNFSFGKIIENHFNINRELFIGDLPLTFYFFFDEQFTTLLDDILTKNPYFVEAKSNFNKINDNFNISDGDIKNFFNSFEILCTAKYKNHYLLDIEDDAKQNIFSYMPHVSRNILFTCIEHIRSGGNLYNFFKELFNEFKKEVITESIPSKLINIKKNSTSEIWWSGDTLVLRSKYSEPFYQKDLNTLLNYVYKIDAGEIK